MAEPAARSGLPGHLHRLRAREDPRRPGSQPPDLHGAGRHLRGHARDPRPVGRGRRRGREILDARSDGDQEPRGRGRVHGGVRRAQGSAGGDRCGLAAGGDADLRRSPAAGLVPLRGPPGLGRDRQGAATGLHRGDRGRRPGEVRRVRGCLGPEVPGDHQALEQRLGRIRALPELRRRDPPRDLHDGCNRQAAQVTPSPSVPGMAGRRGLPAGRRVCQWAASTA